MTGRDKPDGCGLMIERRPLLVFLQHAVLILGAAVFVFPIYLAFVASTHTGVEVNRGLPLLPGDRFWENYSTVLGQASPPAARRRSGTRRDEIDRRIREAAAILHLGDFLARRPRELSGGQRQRVAIGRAIVREPAAFLLDEPLSNLDTKLRAHMRGELKQIHARLGATFIHVTHDQVEAMSLADKIVVMNAGRIEQIGRPREVYDRPASRFVAEFIGAPPMNFLPGAELGRPEPWVGVRPEALSLAPADTAAKGIAVSGRVALVEDLGADSFVHLALPGERTLVARLGAAAAPAEGEIVTVRAPDTALRFFDAEGRSLPAGAGGGRTARQAQG